MIPRLSEPQFLGVDNAITLRYCNEVIFRQICEIVALETEVLPTMTLAIRFIPNPGRAVVYGASGSAYRAAGTTLDIPFPDAETIHSDQAIKLMVVGTTADRPVNVPGRINWPPRGVYDTTLGAPIFLVPGSNPPRWVNIAGVTV